LFGKVVDKNTEGAVITDYKYSESNEPVYALPIKNHGHSLTNMMYGSMQKEKATHLYLIKEGYCYTTKI